jgi:DNA-binding transcriptional regulator LsrR (DeoR family)
MKKIVYKTPMNGNQIAKEIGISRQAVSFALRKAMLKLYKEVIKRKYAETPFDAIYTLMVMFGLNDGSITDIREFVELFPENIQKDIKTDIICHYNV